MRFFFAVMLLGLFWLPAKAEDLDLLVFGADWCPSCVQLKVALENDPTLIKGYRVKIFDLAADADLAKQYKITAVPALLVFTLDGEIRRKVGFTGAADLRRWLQEKKDQRTRLRVRYRLAPDRIN
jgi:thioredoxin-like negative regulator of GroEL